MEQYQIMDGGKNMRKSKQPITLDKRNREVLQKVIDNNHVFTIPKLRGKTGQEYATTFDCQHNAIEIRS